MLLWAQLSWIREFRQIILPSNVYYRLDFNYVHCGTNFKKSPQQIFVVSEKQNKTKVELICLKKQPPSVTLRKILIYYKDCTYEEVEGWRDIHRRCDARFYGTWSESVCWGIYDPVAKALIRTRDVRTAWILESKWKARELNLVTSKLGSTFEYHRDGKREQTACT